MANEFLVNTTKFIDLHGVTASYISVLEGSYNVETGSTTNTETTYNLKIYKKHLKASQYNYPDLIGKNIAMFYISNNSLSFTPAVRDKIVFGSETFTIDSIQEHAALGQVILYRVIGVKS